MPTRMTHPQHGTTYAVGAEIAWNQAHGWKIEPKVKAAPAPAPVAEPSQENVARKTIGLPKARI